MSPRPKLDRIRKAQIRAAAADLIAERGLSGTRITDVAARAGTSKPAVLYWFGDKDTLLSEALTVEDEYFYARVSTLVTASEDPWKQLEVLAHEIAQGYDHKLWMELCILALHDDTADQTRRRLQGTWRDLLVDIVRRGQDRRDFRAGDPVELAAWMDCLLDGLLSQVALSDPDTPPENLEHTWLRAVDFWLRETVG